MTTIDAFWMLPSNNANYGIVNDQRIGAVADGDYILAHPEIHAGTPAGGDFAPEAYVGRNYSSPY